MARTRIGCGVRPLLLTPLLLLPLLLAACSDDRDGVPSRVTATPTEASTSTATPTATATPTEGATEGGTATPSPTAQPGAPPMPSEVGLVPAFDGREFDRAIEIGIYPLGPQPGSSFFVAEQGGRVFVLHPGGDELLLDIRSQVSRERNEEGLLSVAVDPVFVESGYLWVYYSVEGGPRRTRLSRFTVEPQSSNPFVADPDSELVILEVAQPFPNHNGGAIRFGPDGMLYLGLGDGGSAGDPTGNGQNPATLLGSIIRIDVGEATAAEPYRIPEGNPFVGTFEGRGEIWAYGLRNPWRMAFDPMTGQLWAGDVGQGELEEIDVIERGGNYGWNRLEGSSCFEPRSGCDRAGVTLPVAEYDRDAGCSVTGGVVYRGDDVPSLRGSYLFSDFCNGTIWALPPGGGEVVAIARNPDSVVSFGTDLAGEVYIVTFGGPILRIVP